jgi:hypothetical protein
MPALVGRRQACTTVMLLVLAACGPSINSMRTAAVPLQPQPPTHPVRFYLSTQPRCPAEEVGLVLADETMVMVAGLQSEYTGELLRQRVRQLGGDAIVGLHEVVEDLGVTTTRTISRSGTMDSTAVSSSAEFKTNVTPNRLRRLQGTVVRFTQADCRE